MSRTPRTQSSVLLGLPSSHSSIGSPFSSTSITPLGQPASDLQFGLHASPPMVLPSSHASPAFLMPLPQISNERQSFAQPSPSSVLPSSHASAQPVSVGFSAHSLGSRPCRMSTTSLP